MDSTTWGFRFTAALYERSRGFFHAMPTAWGSIESGFMLAKLWQLDCKGSGLSLVPVFGLHAHAALRNELRLPVDKLARLAGLDRGTAAAAAERLATLGLLARRPNVGYRGKRLAEWALSDKLAATRHVNGRFDVRGYFRVAATLIYGGHWARLSATQRALYLAVGSQALPLEPAAALDYVENRVRPGLDLSDVERCGQAVGQGRVRLAQVSATHLAQITGMTRSTVLAAVAGFKHPALWPESSVDAPQLGHAPLAVYPTPPSESHVFHFRDHALPWPYEVLNGESGKCREDGPSVRAGTPALLEAPVENEIEEGP